MASKPDRHSPKAAPKLKTGRYYFPYHPDSVSKARALRKNMTPAEQQLSAIPNPKTPNSVVAQLRVLT
jgi:hypothetical protein